MGNPISQNPTHPTTQPPHPHYILEHPHHPVYPTNYNNLTALPTQYPLLLNIERSSPPSPTTLLLDTESIFLWRF